MDKLTFLAFRNILTKTGWIAVKFSTTIHVQLSI